MYKTVWLIIENDKIKTKFSWYHFGSTPKFPTWYMEKNKTYEIEMIYNIKLIINLKIFFKCLFHHYEIKGV